MASSLRPGLRARESGVGRRLVRSSVVFGGAMFAANGLTAVTQLVLARLLHPADYSLVVTLFVVITVAGVPLGALQATIAREIATAHARSGDAGAGAALRGASRELARLTLPAVAIAVIAAVPVAILLQVHRPAPLVATGIVIVASIGLTVVWGCFQGTHRFNTLAGGQLAFAAVKVVAAVIAAAEGAGLAGVMGAIAAATVLTLALGFVPLAHYVRLAGDAMVERQPLLTRYSAGAAAALTLFAILTTLDVAVARVALTPARAGAYAATSVVTRALLLVPTAITTVLFPRVATLADRSREQRHLLAGIFATAAVGFVATLVFWAAGGPIVRALFGARYGTAGAWVAPLALAMTLYGVAFVYLFHTLSIGRAGFAVVALPIVAVQIAAFAVFHASGRELAFVQVAVGALLVVAAEWYHRRAT